MHKGQARFQDDRWKFFVAWCGQCWFKTQSWFDASLTDEEITEVLKAEHTRHGRLSGSGLCGADVRIRKVEGVEKMKVRKHGR